MRERRLLRSIPGDSPGRAFTLVELLVVISILGLLIAILVPSLRGARRVSKRVKCATQLHSIGQGLRMYLNDSNDYLPIVAFLPSDSAANDENPKPGIAEVLLPYIRKNAETPAEDAEEELEREGEAVFHCPADVPGKTERDGPNKGKSYFETENSSYAFNVYLHMLREGASMTNGAFDEPVKLTEVVRSERARHLFGGQAAEEEVWLLRDYVGFHGKPGTPGAANYLYVDGRVSDLER